MKFQLLVSALLSRTWMVPNVEQLFSPAINFSARNTKDSAMEKQVVLPNVL
jgi:hypothetical protein